MLFPLPLLLLLVSFAVPLLAATLLRLCFHFIVFRDVYELSFVWAGWNRETALRLQMYFELSRKDILRQFTLYQKGTQLTQTLTQNPAVWYGVCVHVVVCMMMVWWCDTNTKMWKCTTNAAKHFSSGQANIYFPNCQTVKIIRPNKIIVSQLKAMHERNFPFGCVWVCVWVCVCIRRAK